MAVTYGFYDSLNHDRLYNAQQMSAIFDGVINDGVFASVGNQLHTVAGSGMQVIVKSGRAWFDSTWTLNHAEYPLSIDAADVLLTRIDAVVLEVNSEVATRANTIKVVKGTPASTPAKPALTNTAAVHQHALAYVTVAKNTTAITNSMIEIVIGKTETPYVTAILQTTDITDLFKKWENDFQVWFETVRSTLDGDVALNLQNQITTLSIRVDTIQSTVQTLSEDHNTTKGKIYVESKKKYGSFVPYYNISRISDDSIVLSEYFYFQNIDRYVGVRQIDNKDVICLYRPGVGIISRVNLEQYASYHPYPVYASNSEILYLQSTNDNWIITKISISENTITKTILTDSLSRIYNMNASVYCIQSVNALSGPNLGMFPHSNNIGNESGFEVCLYSNNTITTKTIPAPYTAFYNSYAVGMYQIDYLLFISTVSWDSSSSTYIPIYLSIYDLSTNKYVLSINTTITTSEHPSSGVVGSTFGQDISYIKKNNIVYVYYRYKGYVKVNISDFTYSVTNSSLYSYAMAYKNMFFYMYNYAGNATDNYPVYLKENPDDVDGIYLRPGLVYQSPNMIGIVPIPDNSRYSSSAFGRRMNTSDVNWISYKPIYIDGEIGLCLSSPVSNYIMILSETTIFGGISI